LCPKPWLIFAAAKHKSSVNLNFFGLVVAGILLFVFSCRCGGSLPFNHSGMVSTRLAGGIPVSTPACLQ